MFRVYHCPQEASGVSAIEHWWESKVGVGDIATVGASAATDPSKAGQRGRAQDSEAPERIPKILEEPPPDSPTLPPASVDPSPKPASAKPKLGLTSRFLRRQRSI